MVQKIIFQIYPTMNSKTHKDFTVENVMSFSVIAVPLTVFALDSDEGALCIVLFADQQDISWKYFSESCVTFDITKKLEA